MPVGDSSSLSGRDLLLTAAGGGLTSLELGEEGLELVDEGLHLSLQRRLYPAINLVEESLLIRHRWRVAVAT